MLSKKRQRLVTKLVGASAIVAMSAVGVLALSPRAKGACPADTNCYPFFANDPNCEAAPSAYFDCSDKTAVGSGTSWRFKCCPAQGNGPISGGDVVFQNSPKPAPGVYLAGQCQ